MDTTQSSNLFGCLPAVVLGFVLTLFGVAGFSQTVPAPPVPVVTAVSSGEAQAATGGVESLTIVETVSIQVSASLPATVTLKVEGYHPDGCKFPVMVEQSRGDKTVNVKIYRIVPTDVMCTMDLNPYSDTITLDGTFDSGTYELTVNGTVIELQV